MQHPPTGPRFGYGDVDPGPAKPRPLLLGPGRVAPSGVEVA